MAIATLASSALASSRAARPPAPAASPVRAASSGRYSFQLQMQGLRIVGSWFSLAPTRAPGTEIPHAQSKQGENVVHFRDEFKIRLPPILDGSHYLQFSLFNIELSENMEDGNAGINAESLAEGLLPITKKSEPSYKYQVATLIPNGVSIYSYSCVL